MAIKNMVGYIGKREWAAWGILAAVFVVLIAFHSSVWVFIVVAAAFVGYVSWTTSAYFVAQRELSGKTITALALPVCLAICKTALCLGVAWLIVWLARHLFGL